MQNILMNATMHLLSSNFPGDQEDSISVQTWLASFGCFSFSFYEIGITAKDVRGLKVHAFHPETWMEKQQRNVGVL